MASRARPAIKKYTTRKMPREKRGVNGRDRTRTCDLGYVTAAF
jgi:hypothetical protein